MLGALELELEPEGDVGAVLEPEPAEPLPDTEPLIEPLGLDFVVSLEDELDAEPEGAGVVAGAVDVEDEDEPVAGVRRLVSSPQAARPNERATATAMVESFIQCLLGLG